MRVKGFLSVVFVVIASIGCGHAQSTSLPNLQLSVQSTYQPISFHKTLNSQQLSSSQVLRSTQLLTADFFVDDQHQSIMQPDDYTRELSNLYSRLVINFTELDNYAVKYKFTNRALYEAGKNTIFSQVENPFACNSQF
jgi:hypothetical protein